MTNWMIAAIEAEAMKRARAEVLIGDGLMVFGLNKKQIAYLIADWKNRNGHMPVPGGHGTMEYVLG